jgi:hypothetical protein
MFRFIVVAGLVLPWTGIAAHAHSQSEPSPLQACESRIAISDMHWRHSNDPFPSIEGVLVNRSGSTLRKVILSFLMKAGADLTGQASVELASPLVFGGQWRFQAPLFQSVDGRIYTNTDTLSVSCLAGSARFDGIVHFEALFLPAISGERQGEIHGTTQR